MSGTFRFDAFSLLWVVIAGVSGPETLAAAPLLDSFEAKFPASQPGQPSPVLWTVVESHIRIRPDATGDKREITGQRYLFEPRVHWG